MSVIDIHSPGLRAPGLSFFVRSLERAAGAVAAWRRARATEAALADLSDEQLADIGIHRGAIAEVAASLAARR